MAVRMGFGLVGCGATPFNGGPEPLVKLDLSRSRTLLLLLLFTLIIDVLTTYAFAAQTVSAAGPRETVMQAIRACWPQAQPVDKPLWIKLSLKVDGSLAGKPQVIDPMGAVADGAAEGLVLRAIQHCAPFKGLKAFKANYRDWRETTVEIAPTARTVAAAAGPTTPVATPAATTDAGVEPGLVASAAIAVMLIFQMLSDAGFAFQSWRRHRQAGQPGPWQTAQALPSRPVKHLSRPLDPVSDPKNWRE
ncbi:hypothetical protein BA190_25410 [Labrys sp. WJW]|uniref:hypothetical protein n=1 Tax=Labrys sp. WJW TaxID=1737983 RepID=UPI0008345DCA|nr:hypothetical protein [Labrys sp. WJW]OCC02111.1 hypothetical protein BA190_25410 [Labrys sp. WJW]